MKDNQMLHSEQQSTLPTSLAWVFFDSRVYEILSVVVRVYDVTLLFLPTFWEGGTRGETLCLFDFRARIAEMGRKRERALKFRPKQSSGSVQ